MIKRMSTNFIHNLALIRLFKKQIKNEKKIENVSKPALNY